MFDVKGKKEIGDYLRDLIEQKFGTPSEFCRAYIEVSGSQNDETKFTNLKNRISSIVNGKKDIQLYDFPVFTKLLDVSCEEILSAGETKTATANHLTNYQIASSHDKKLWEFCINSEDSIFLNPDEYDKTILDYVFTFKNYPLLKHLVDNEYVWFVEQNPGERCGMSFYGGTSIKRRPLGNSKTMEAQLTGDDSLRRKMIVLAIENNDVDMLDEFRAREIPLMYQKLHETEFNKLSMYYDEDLIEAASRADQSVLDYFSEVITITPTLEKAPFQCMYPFLGALIEKLIEQNNPYADTLLRRCIEHNKGAYEKVKELKDRKYGEGKNTYSMFRLCFYQGSHAVEVLEQKDCIATNLIRIDTDLDSELIKELNSYYDKILDIAREEGDYVF